MVRLLAFLLTMISLPVAADPIDIALTFDDLPFIWDTPPAGYSNQKIIEDIIRVLARHKVKGAFAFVNGGKIKSPADKKIIDLWTRHGHLLGNHTWSHADLNTSASGEFIGGIKRNHRFLAGYRQSFVPYFRYPFLHEGNTRERRSAVRSYLRESGYRIAQVTVDHNDWEWYKPFSRCNSRDDEAGLGRLRDLYDSEAMANLKAAQLLSEFLFGRSIKHIALMHPNVMTVERLDTTLTNWKNAGARFITLREAMDDPVYRIDPNFLSESPSLFTNQIRKARGLQNPPEVFKIYQRTLDIERELEETCVD